MKTLVKRATAENFTRFGSIVTYPTAAPTAEGETFKFWSDIAHYHITGETEIGLCTVYRQPLCRVTGVERHIRTPEILIPVDGPFDLPVLLEGDSDASLEVFRFLPGEAAVMKTGVWHGACLPVRTDKATYFVIFRRGTPAEDVIKKDVGPVSVETDGVTEVD